MTTAELQLIAQIQYGTAGTVWHVKASGNDTTGDGLSWATAYATATKAATVKAAGDVIVLGSDISDNGAINLQDSGGGLGASLVAALGKRYKITTTAVNTVNPSIIPGNRSVIRGIILVNTISDFSAPIGVFSSQGYLNATDVLFEDCRIEADSDIVQIQGLSGCHYWTFRRCWFQTKWDAIVSNGSNWIVENCDFRLTGDSVVTGSGVNARAILHSGGSLTVRNSRFKQTGVVTNNYCVMSQGSSTIVNVDNCKFQVTGGTNNYNLRTTGSGTIYADGTNVGDGTYGVLTTLVSSGAITPRPGVAPTAGGTGTRSVTITVNDGATAIQGAQVRINLNSTDNQVATTNASGIASFSTAADGTYAVTISAPGYSFTPTTLVVSADTSHTYSMTAVAISASNPGFVTGFGTCYDEDGLPEANVTVSLKAFKVGGDVGAIGSNDERDEISNGSGLVQFTNLIAGWTYAVTRGDTTVKILIPSDAVTSYELWSFIG